MLLETPRLYFREINLSDIQAMFEMDSNPNVQKYVGNHPIKTIEQIQEVISNFQNQYKEFGIARWAVIEKETNQFIGWAGWKYIDFEINKHSNHYDLGYRFLEKEWNKGYASECVKALIEFGKTNFDRDKLFAYTNSQNQVSNHILQKHGFDLIETFTDEDGDFCNWFKLQN